MSHKDNQDLRVIENGGWFWGEQELFTIFAPIIGPVGLAVYAAMARLIPLAATDSDKQIRVRRVSEFSCVGRSKCAEEMRKLIDVGMVLETKYLDGRDPTYKLASLRGLAKLGQKELLKRAGVLNTDTAPFDQVAKHRRERKQRLEKEAQEEAKQAAVRETPLFNEENQAGKTGVRAADTSFEAGDNRGRVLIADTVSAETGSVSAKSGFVSAGADTLKEEKKNGDLLKTPLPPAGRGEVGCGEADGDPDQARPSVPGGDCTFVDAGFAPSVPLAAAWVMADAGITDRRLAPVIGTQLTTHCGRNRSLTLGDCAAKMAQQSRLLHEHADRLRHRPWGWRKFFEHGHWSRPLPYESASDRRDAAVGMSREQKPVSDDARVRTFIRANASKVGANPELASFAAELLALADRRDEPSLEAVDRELTVIEARILDSVLATYSKESREELNQEVRLAWQAVHAKYRGLPESQRDSITETITQKFVFEKLGLPRLSLFYMPPA